MKFSPLPLALLLLVVIAGVWAGSRLRPKMVTPATAPTPSPTVAPQLPLESQPQVTLKFTNDGHFVTVSLTDLAADRVEYNLIYDATVKNNRIQTGVSSAADITGQSTFSQRQLLGSESSGKFTYHQQITNAVMELTLRDTSGRSVFTATYPFTVSAGKSVVLTQVST